jgi:hypothetical protein
LVADKSNQQRGEDIPRGIERLILPELLVESRSPNNPECDRRDCVAGPRVRLTLFQKYETSFMIEGSKIKQIEVYFGSSSKEPA